MRRVFVPAAAALLVVAGAANAHPKLVSATPAPNATVAAPARVTLRFSERLMPKFSGADMMMTGMNGMKHAPMKVASAATVAADGRTLVIAPKSPLGTGTYSVAWHVVSADTHRITGNYAFAVK
ncbi:MULTISPECIES: copper homeostasis periplasmic binding protein CopC [unclassified Sphingomonas]|jgi:methionine-rich copper-binding protein CopC|uniref:copper homeostasis periplasmic binding protein CopC n=1 Tax=unclassified Sphingomonas TaxID=196159 RepID=UPI0006F7757D|nr:MULTISPECIES: copper homeostasis periplasmic binding protein CopC [unclassified Sphingomonas]KQM27903.1 copper resistance protein CopC [Sphingomonas sp. Leaf9]KQM44243.1 copper resistance protein CopC [Sphingomonas sp. Leaf11]